MALSGPGRCTNTNSGASPTNRKQSIVASTEFSAALRAPAHPSAKPGYGKRSAPDQLPRTGADFAHLRTREAAIAAYIDRLTEGAAIGYKPLAANVADYGQQACAKALKFLSEAGHLRLVKEHLTVADNSRRWVTRTYFSRTSRDDDWWKAYTESLCGVDVTELDRDRDRPVEPPAPAAALKAPAPSLDPTHITRAVMLCIGCEEPETVVTLIRGVCVECREEMEAYDAAEEKGLVIDAIPDTFRAVPAKVEVARRADELRAAAGLKARPIPLPTQGDFARGLTRNGGAERARGAE